MGCRTAVLFQVVRQFTYVDIGIDWLFKCLYMNLQAKLLYCMGIVTIYSKYDHINIIEHILKY
ncbi:hypothetical protein D9G17_21435 [Escherichia coli]|nr:hypothetical protein [Escherichia coli]